MHREDNRDLYAWILMGIEMGAKTPIVTLVIGTQIMLPARGNLRHEGNLVILYILIIFIIIKKKKHNQTLLP